MKKLNQNNKQIIKPDKCPKCGGEFLCSNSPKCWCFEYEVVPDNKEKLQQDYEGCLCPKCLKEFAT